MVKRFVCVLGFMLALCACGAPGPTQRSAGHAAPKQLQAPDGDFRQYRIWVGETPDLLDAGGNFVDEADAITPFYDCETGALCYLTLARYEDTGAIGSNGEPIVQELHALYDPDGALIHDWTPGRLEPAFGDFVILRDPVDAADADYLPADYATALWNPRTGEMIAEAGSVRPLGGGAFAVCDVYDRVMGTLDREGQPLGGFPIEENYYFPWGGQGFLTASLSDFRHDGGEQGEVLLDRGLAPLLKADRIDVGGRIPDLRGPFLLLFGDGRDRVLRLPDLQERLSINSARIGLIYYDGQRMILRGPEGFSSLYDADGERLSAPYDQIRPADEKPEEPAKQFLAALGGTYFLLDREGETTATFEYPGLNFVDPLAPGLYTYQIRLSRSTDRIGTRVGLLGPGFEILLPADRYDAIQTIPQPDIVPPGPGLFQAFRTLPNGVVRIDLIDETGRLVLDSLSQIGEADADRVAVVRGSSMGLVDGSGNWIARHSIYHNLQND